MSRPLRIEYPGAWYHVMNRGANKNPIFFEPSDRRVFLKVLAESVTRFGIQIYAYALMNNHYHLLVQTPLGNIGRAMRHIDAVYTQKINRRYNRDGALMRGRYKSILIEKQNYLLHLVRYIHLNGVRAGQCASPLEDRNTSHRSYLNLEETPPWLRIDEILNSFGTDPAEARQSFHEFVMVGGPSRFGENSGSRKMARHSRRETFYERNQRKISKAEEIQQRNPPTQSIAGGVKSRDLTP